MSKQPKLPSAQRQKLPTMRGTMQAIRCMNTIDLEEWLEVRATMAEWSKAYEGCEPLDTKDNTYNETRV